SAHFARLFVADVGVRGGVFAQAPHPGRAETLAFGLVSDPIDGKSPAFQLVAGETLSHTALDHGIPWHRAVCQYVAQELAHGSGPRFTAIGYCGLVDSRCFVGS